MTNTPERSLASRARRPGAPGVASAWSPTVAALVVLVLVGALALAGAVFSAPAARAERTTSGPTDYGDAPTSYGRAGAFLVSDQSPVTPSTGFGASETVLPVPRLGALVDGEDAYFASTDATADDGNGQGDEDAVEVLETITTAPGATYTLNVACTGPGFAAGWIDWNANGTFEDGERSNVAECTDGSVELTWTVPKDVTASTAGTTFLRLRVAADQSELTPDGVSTAGEVEDHAVTVALTGEAAGSQALDQGDGVQGAAQGDAVAQCTPNFVYAVTGGSADTLKGAIIRIAHDGPLVTGASVAFEVALGNVVPSSLNALAASRDGQSFFVTRSWSAATGGTVRDILKVTADGQEVITSAFPGIAGSLIAGAIDPATGDYYFGSASTNSRHIGNVPFLRVYRLAAGSTTPVEVGDLDTSPVSTTGAVNGDFAFDGAGNLIFVGSLSGVSRLFTLSQDELHQSDYRLTPSAVSASLDSDNVGMNGMAFSPQEYMFASSGRGIRTYDPNTLQQYGSVFNVESTGVLDGVGTMTDLASCDIPSTLGLRKDIVSRVAGSDQFNLEIQRINGTTGTSLGTARTSGATTGVQTNAVLGPVPAVAGAEYEVRETGAAGANLGNYTISLQCMSADGTDVPVHRVSAGVHRLTFPTVAGPTTVGAAVTCTYTNRPVGSEPLRVLVEKVGESVDGTWVRMDGSAWSLLADVNGAPGAVLTAPVVAPVTGQTGLFEITDIPEGIYWLTETKAPDGFSLLAEPVRFQVGADGTVSLLAGAGDDVVTAQVTAEGVFQVTVRDVPALELPTTGGSGTAPFVVFGCLLLACAGALSVRAARGQKAARA